MIRNKSLDSLRGLAIIFVLIAHYFSNGIGYDGVTLLLGKYDINFGFIGRLGVILFFLLSGFLIISSLQKNSNIFVFYKKRFLRIYPPYLFSIVIVALISFFVTILHIKYDLFTYMANIFMVQDLVGSKLINGVYWTLLLEIKFYFFIPIIFILNKYLKRDILEYLFYLMIILNIFIYFYRGYASTLLIWEPIFFLGIYLYRFFSNEISLNKLMGVFFIYMIYIEIVDSIEMSLFILFNFILFYTFYKFRINNFILNFFGKISYSLYLLHTVVSYPLLYIMSKYWCDYCLFLKIMIVLIVSLVLSMLSNFYIENIYFKKKGNS